MTMNRVANACNMCISYAYRGARSWANESEEGVVIFNATNRARRAAGAQRRRRAAGRA